jgi:hypothetical protein
MVGGLAFLGYSPVSQVFVTAFNRVKPLFNAIILHLIVPME